MMRRWPCLLALVVGLGGCSKQSPTAPEPSELPPNLRAYEGSLYWPDIPIGASQQALAPNRGPGVAKVSTHEINQVVLGTSCLPLVRQVCTGSFPDYRIHFYVDGTLWWDRQSSAVAPRGMALWEGIFGMGWVPTGVGEHEIRVVLDATHQCKESDETDNEVTFIVRVLPPDLVAGLMEVVEWRGGYPYRVTSVKAGTPVQVISNTFCRGIYMDHRHVVEGPSGVMLDHRASLQGGTYFPGMRADTLVFVPTTAGTLQFRTLVDPDQEFLDGNRSNNTATLQLTVTE